MSHSFPHRCWADVDLDALTKNVRRIRQTLPDGSRYLAVVKADGYGTGAKKVVEALHPVGIDMFGVANVAEAVDIRQVVPETPILLLSANLPQEDDYLFEYRLTPTVSTLEEIQRYQQVAERRQTKLPVHLKFDTGMGRLGIWHERAEQLLKAASQATHLELRGLYSHFASADDSNFTGLQRQRFCQILDQAAADYDDLWIHIDNSLGLASRSPAGPFKAVRVGLLQFGVVPEGDERLRRLGLSPVVSLHSRVSVVKDLPRGSTVSYGRTHTLARDSRVAVITAGYADGILRSCSNRGHVLIRGKKCPILGIVTMDEIVVDVTDVPGAATGDLATFIGRQEGAEITIDDYSSACGTIPWEALCAMSKRVARVYRQPADLQAMLETH